jgi:hypothetical protein
MSTIGVVVIYIQLYTFLAAAAALSLLGLSVVRGEQRQELSELGSPQNSRARQDTKMSGSSHAAKNNDKHRAHQHHHASVFHK